VTDNTRKLYTINQKVGNVASRPTRVVWMGNTHDVIKEFPSEVRQTLGKGLRDVQDGRIPQDSDPVPGVGRNGIFELKDQDADAWYRVIYLKKIEDRVFVLHCFEKETNQIDKQDLRTIKARLVAVEKILAEEKRREKRSG
jgi:phage-related protein